MQVREDDPLETDVPALAVRALKAAQQRARIAGRIVVLMRGRDLVRVLPDGTYQVLRTLPPRKKVVRHTPASGS